ncbi:MAG: hypothetical protein WBW33_02725 [Bryobacteraceae bacterium]
MGYVASAASTSQSWRKRIAPAITLLILAPVVAEVLSGATRVSFLVVLIPEIMVWGCGALMIREIALRWRAGWTSMLLLGLALAVAEEFIIQQTSIAPLPWLSGQAYGRAFGVNWVYFLYMLGYESVWVVLVPIQLTQLIFPERRNEEWLRTGGLVISAPVFMLGSFIAWFTWTQQARTVVFHAPKYSPPPALIFAGLLAIALLAAAAWAVRGIADAGMSPSRKAPNPWLVKMGTFLLGMPWWVLISLVFIPNVPIAPAIPLAAGLLWAILAYAVIRRWSSSTEWSDIHRWGVVFSAILVCMVGGFAGSSVWPRIDVIGKAVLNVIAVVSLLALARKLSNSRTT